MKHNNYRVEPEIIVSYDALIEELNRLCDCKRFRNSDIAIEALETVKWWAIEKRLFLLLMLKFKKELLIC